VQQYTAEEFILASARVARDKFNRVNLRRVTAASKLIGTDSKRKPPQLETSFLVDESDLKLALDLTENASLASLVGR
jgi:hypothetical protein